jgi:hypothetical protein
MDVSSLPRDIECQTLGANDHEAVIDTMPGRHGRTPDAMRIRRATVDACKRHRFGYRRLLIFLRHESFVATTSGSRIHVPPGPRAVVDGRLTLPKPGRSQEVEIRLFATEHEVPIGVNGRRLTKTMQSSIMASSLVSNRFRSCC